MLAARCHCLSIDLVATALRGQVKLKTTLREPPATTRLRTFEKRRPSFVNLGMSENCGTFAQPSTPQSLTRNLEHALASQLARSLDCGNALRNCSLGTSTNTVRPSKDLMFAQLARKSGRWPAPLVPPKGDPKTSRRE